MFESDSGSPGEPGDEVAGERVPSVWELMDWYPDTQPTAAELLADAQGQAPGATQFAGLAQVDVRDLSADDAVSALQEMQRFTSHAAGVEARLRAQVTDRVVAHMEAEFAADAERERRSNEDRVAQGLAPVGVTPRYVFPEQVAFSEITAALRMSPVTGEARILIAQELAGAWRPLLDAMIAGTITSDHTAAIAKRLRDLPGYSSNDPAEAAAYEKHCAAVLGKVVPYACTHTPGEAGKKTGLLVTAIDPDGARARRRKAAQDSHGVTVTPLEPGTSEFRAVGPTAHIEAMHHAVRTLARDARFETGPECVTRGQRQVAALSTLVLGDPGSVASVTGPVAEAKLGINLSVIVSLDTIAGASEQGGRIGAAPATADEVRDLIGAACEQSSTIRRLVTDAAGCILDAGRKKRFASDLQRFVLDLRDRTCRHPGCPRPADQCQIDHATSWNAGGRTDISDLGPLCQHHHQLKTGGHWAMTASARDGTCIWRSPLGRIYEHTPPDLLPPRPARSVPAGTAPDNYDPPPF